jgi:hypothetical protein
VASSLSPRSHRRQGERASASARPPEPTDSALWREGVALFNHGRFFECHEIWEILWKRSADPDRIFYQAMIQTAAAALHASKGNRRGALSLWTKASEKLDAFGESCKGVALDRLRVDVGRYLDEAASDSPERTPPRIRKPVSSRRR